MTTETEYTPTPFCENTGVLINASECLAHRTIGGIGFERLADQQALIDDLVEALEEIERFISFGENLPTAANFKRIGRKARDALSKARGEGE